MEGPSLLGQRLLVELLLHLLLRVEVLDHCLLGILLALRLVWEGFLDALVSREGSFLGKMSLGMGVRMLHVHLLEVFLAEGSLINWIGIV